jgi:hypothetical protein
MGHGAVADMCRHRLSKYALIARWLAATSARRRSASRRSRVRSWSAAGRSRPSPAARRIPRGRARHQGLDDALDVVERLQLEQAGQQAAWFALPTAGLVDEQPQLSAASDRCHP